MPEWVSEWVPVLQLILNAGALVGGAVIWRLYVDSLKAASEVKDATIQNIGISRDHWREKAEDLEKRSPEVVEKSLSERIKIRDEEITRFKMDREFDKITLRTLEIEKAELEQDLFRTKGFRAMLALEDSHEDQDESEDELSEEVEPFVEETPKTIEVAYIGGVGVDSGQLMVTDPCYVDSDWRNEPYAIVGEVERSEDTLFNYSYDGACRATLTGGGHGELAFELGHAGAGVAFSTAWGDGIYPVYAEKHDGRIVRVYVNVG
jgi:hypothetical protein